MIENFPPSRKLVNRFVAGKTLKEVLSVVESLNDRGMLTTLDYLGENIETEKETDEVVNTYIKILGSIRDGEKYNANISLKLTHLGLNISRKLCENNLRKVLKRAKEFNNFVRIDMESSAYTDITLQIYYNFVKDFPENVGVVLQAYLYRTEKDLEEIIKRSGNVRLCKGAYQEPKNIAFPRKKDVDKNFIRLIEQALSAYVDNKKFKVAVATHDEKIIKWTIDWVKDNGIKKNDFEFQMLYGIRPDLQESLESEGYRIRVYVPYGAGWYPYFMRRLGERPANTFFIVKNIFRV